jgi:hypothetical protein
LLYFVYTVTRENLSVSLCVFRAPLPTRYDATLWSKNEMTQVWEKPVSNSVCCMIFTIYKGYTMVGSDDFPVDATQRAATSPGGLPIIRLEQADDDDGQCAVYWRELGLLMQNCNGIFQPHRSSCNPVDLRQHNWPGKTSNQSNMESYCDFYWRTRRSFCESSFHWTEMTHFVQYHAHLHYQNGFCLT